MKVILTENIENLGQAGEVKEVANGYARNYLLPRGLASQASVGALKQLERQRALIERRAAEKLESARSMADRLNTTEVVVYAKSGEQSRLYGSVTTTDVAAALKEQYGIEVDRRNITIDEAIHRLGNYHATVKLTGGQTGKLTLVVDSEENRGKPRPPKVQPTTEMPTADADAGMAADSGMMADNGSMMAADADVTADNSDMMADNGSMMAADTALVDIQPGDNSNLLPTDAEFADEGKMLVATDSVAADNFDGVSVDVVEIPEGVALSETSEEKL